MQHIMITTIITVGAAALTLSLVPLIMVLRRKRMNEMNQLDLEASNSAATDTLISQKESEQVFNKIARKYISSMFKSKGKKSVREEELDAFTLSVNADTLLQLQFLPWMTPDRMINTVTDLLGLSLSRPEKQYACYMIKSNMERCKKALSPNARESVAQTFERVLEQIVI